MDLRASQAQESLFVVTADLPAMAGHPFYDRLNAALRVIEFDRRPEAACERFYGDTGRRSIPLGVYFRMLLIGYFEGIDSERGIAWRVGDSLSLRQFLGCGLTGATPNHSSLSRIRQRLDNVTHDKAFELVLAALVKAKLVKSKTVGVNATTLEADAAMRSIDRRNPRERLDPFRLAFSKAGVVLDTESRWAIGATRDSFEMPQRAYEMVYRQVRHNELPTAFFFGDDELALAAIHALTDAGRGVPGDVSVLGHDDAPLTRHARPPLTIVREPGAELGAVGFRLLEQI